MRYSASLLGLKIKEQIDSMCLLMKALMKTIKVTTYSHKETQKLARLLAHELWTSDVQRKGALVIALEGDLGGGKTTFAQGFARGLGIREKVLSPTFVILKNYPLQTTHYKLFVHMDAYRLKSTKELQVLGWRDILKDTEAIVLVEWADRVRRALPKEYIRILFEFVDEKTRNIIISNF